jgi:hypothetical protein
MNSDIAPEAASDRGKGLPSEWLPAPIGRSLLFHERLRTAPTGRTSETLKAQ